MPGWLSQWSTRLLILAQVMIPGSWDQAWSHTPCWAWSLLKIFSPDPLPLPLSPANALSLSQIKKNTMTHCCYPNFRSLYQNNVFYKLLHIHNFFLKRILITVVWYTWIYYATRMWIKHQLKSANTFKHSLYIRVSTTCYEKYKDINIKMEYLITLLKRK